MTARVITFASAKGGAGKTTLTATFGKFLSHLGFKVLIADCDEATNGLTLLYIEEVNQYTIDAGKERSKCIGVLDLYNLDEDVVDIVPLHDGIHFVPAVFSFSKRKPIPSEEFRKTLLDIIIVNKMKYDFIILDAQAGSDPISLVAMMPEICEVVVIVSEYDPLSAAGVERLKGISGDSLSFERTWVILNKMLPEFVSSFSEFLSVSHYIPPIPWTADVVRAYAKRELALNFESGNEFTLAIMQSIRSLPFKEVGVALDSWVENRATVLREPITTQYADLEHMLAMSNYRAHSIKSISRRKNLLRLFGLTVILAGALVSVIVLRLNLVKVFSGVYSEFLIVIGATFGAGLYLAAKIGMTYVASSSGGLSVEAEIELEKIDRQSQVYKERLKELEFLMAADSVSLLKNRFAR